MVDCAQGAAQRGRQPGGTGDDVSVGAGTLIGIGAVVMPQRRVGAWCVVRAGALITRDLSIRWSQPAPQRASNIHRNSLRILSAGGQGQGLADALLFAAEAGQPVTPVGYLDDNPALWQRAPLGLPVLGALVQLSV